MNINNIFNEISSTRRKELEMAANKRKSLYAKYGPKKKPKSFNKKELENKCEDLIKKMLEKQRQ